jgi:hypothetical protein
MVSATTLVVTLTLAISATLATAAARTARAQPRSDARPMPTAVVPERDDAPPHSCSQPACRDVRPDSGRDGEVPFTPVDIRVHLGEIAVASMEGLWLRRGPTLRNEPIMVSPVVVGDAVTLALGGRF